MMNLKQTFGSRYQVWDDGTNDPDRSQRPWCQEIPGRLGVIYPYSHDGTLAVRSESAWASRRLADLGLVLRQKGDFEAVFLFPPSRLDEIASIIHAKRRRVLSPEQRAKQAIILAEARKRLASSRAEPVSACQGPHSAGQEGGSRGAERVR